MFATVRRIGGRRARTGAIVAGIALAFGAGAVTVYAIDPGGSDGSAAAPAASLTPRAIAPGISTGGDAPQGKPANLIAPGGPRPAGDSVANSLPPSTGQTDAARGGAFYSSPGYGKDGFAPRCPATIAKAVSGSTIDPAGEGFQMSLLKGGFSLQSISVRGEGECNDKGLAKDGKVVVDSGWVHDATGIQVFLSQHVSAKAVASVRAPGYVQVSTGGYLFTVNANPYMIYAADGGPISAEASAAASPKYPGGPPPADPKVAEALDAAIAQVAPSFDKACFYVQKEGAWADLKTLGIGDPRPALPKGYTEQGSQFVTFTTPPASCNAPALGQGGSFNANFVLESGGRDGTGYLSLGASSIPDGQPAYPGYFDGFNANWSNGKFQFNVSGGFSGDVQPARPGGLGEDVIRAIATAMDPGFANACLMKNRQLTENEFLALGFRAPVVPETFRLENSQFNASEINGNCKVLPEGVGNTQNGNWHYSSSSPDTFLDVSIGHYPGAGKSGPGSISGYGLNWTDGKGTQFAVNGFTGRKETLGKDVLIAIAKSIDPTLDVSKLDEQPEVPRPYGR